jgi:pyruvate/2-oxoglutarate dehydrogenase complex dihydrolipoamide acyltransferase (E2) component
VDQFGIGVAEPTLDVAKTHAYKRDIVDKSVKGIEFLFKKNKVEGIKGYGRVTDAHHVEVDAGEGGKRTLSTRFVLIATGSVPREIGVAPSDGERIVNSDHVLEMERVPKSIVVLGAGAVGTEFASVYRSFGSEVTLVEMLPRVLPIEDEEVSKEVERQLKKRGIKVMTGTQLTAAEAVGGGVRVALRQGNMEAKVEAELLLVAVGRAPVTGDIGLEAIGVETEKGYVPVNGTMQTEGRQRLRDRRRREHPLAGARRLGRRDPCRRAHGRARSGAARPRSDPVVHLLRAGGRKRRPYRGEGQGARLRGGHREVRLLGQRQGAHPRQGERLRQDRAREEVRRDPRRAHRRTARDRPDRRGLRRAPLAPVELPAAVAASGATAPQGAAEPGAERAEEPRREEPAAAAAGLVRSREEVRARPAEQRTAKESSLTFSVPAYNEDEQVEIEPMTPIRRLTAAHMLYSQQTSAHVATVFDVDMSSVVAARARAKARFLEKTGTKLTYMPFLFEAVIDGLRTYPKFNASIDGTDIVYKKDIHLGMAVALDWGLIVPVIHHADRLNLVGLATHANDLADRARLKRLRPEEVRGGTFTVTNPGVMGSLFGIPMINQPQVAILCFGAVEKRPVVITDAEGNDGIGIRWMANLALSYDHRLIDGADAEQFMVRIKKTLTESSWDELAAFS